MREKLAPPPAPNPSQTMSASNRPRVLSAAGTATLSRPAPCAAFRASLLDPKKAVRAAEAGNVARHAANQAGEIRLLAVLRRCGAMAISSPLPSRSFSALTLRTNARASCCFTCTAQHKHVTSDIIIARLWQAAALKPGATAREKYIYLL